MNADNDLFQILTTHSDEFMDLVTKNNMAIDDVVNFYKQIVKNAAGNLTAPFFNAFKTLRNKAAFIRFALKNGDWMFKLSPAQIKAWEYLHDAGPSARKLLDDPDFVRKFGDDLATDPNLENFMAANRGDETAILTYKYGYGEFEIPQTACPLVP